jgi:hypothetical protein
MMKSFALVLVALFAVVGCGRTPSVGDAPMSNDLTAPSPVARAAKPVALPLPRPVLPSPSKGLGGVPDDSVRPVGPSASSGRTGVPDDSVRTR